MDLEIDRRKHRRMGLGQAEAALYVAPKLCKTSQQVKWKLPKDDRGGL
ncbi:MAG: hypothetical protein ACREIG_04880 [Nitrospiraceae bacterium]